MMYILLLCLFFQRNETLLPQIKLRPSSFMEIHSQIMTNNKDKSKEKLKTHIKARVHTKSDYSTKPEDMDNMINSLVNDDEDTPQLNASKSKNNDSETKSKVQTFEAPKKKEVDDKFDLDDDDDLMPVQKVENKEKTSQAKNNSESSDLNKLFNEKTSKINQSPDSNNDSVINKNSQMDNLKLLDKNIDSIDKKPETNQNQQEEKSHKGEDIEHLKKKNSLQNEDNFFDQKESIDSNPFQKESNSLENSSITKDKSLDDLMNDLNSNSPNEKIQKLNTNNLLDELDTSLTFKNDEKQDKNKFQDQKIKSQNKDKDITKLNKNIESNPQKDIKDDKNLTDFSNDNEKKAKIIKNDTTNDLNKDKLTKNENNDLIQLTKDLTKKENQNDKKKETQSDLDQLQKNFTDKSLQKLDNSNNTNGSLNDTSIATKTQKSQSLFFETDEQRGSSNKKLLRLFGSENKNQKNLQENKDNQVNEKKESIDNNEKNQQGSSDESNSNIEPNRLKQNQQKPQANDDLPDFTNDKDIESMIKDKPTISNDDINKPQNDLFSEPQNDSNQKQKNMSNKKTADFFPSRFKQIDNNESISSKMEYSIKDNENGHQSKESIESIEKNNSNSDNQNQANDKSKVDYQTQQDDNEQQKKDIMPIIKNLINKQNDVIQANFRLEQSHIEDLNTRITQQKNLIQQKLNENKSLKERFLISQSELERLQNEYQDAQLQNQKKLSESQFQNQFGDDLGSFLNEVKSMSDNSKKAYEMLQSTISNNTQIHNQAESEIEVIKGEIKNLNIEKSKIIDLFKEEQEKLSKETQDFGQQTKNLQEIQDKVSKLRQDIDFNSKEIESFDTKEKEAFQTLMKLKQDLNKESNKKQMLSQQGRNEQKESEDLTSQIKDLNQQIKHIEEDVEYSNQKLQNYDFDEKKMKIDFEIKKTNFLNQFQEKKLDIDKQKRKLQDEIDSEVEFEMKQKQRISRLKQIEDKLYNQSD